ncbi:NAD(P)-binding protein, partial [Terfezia boudieri ATCC MYA-4762]
VEEISTKQLEDHFQGNVFSHIAITRMVLPHMRKRRDGTILFMGSLATGWGGYCTGKMALAAIIKSLRAEVKPFGITVTMCESGCFRIQILSSTNSASERGIVLGG